MQEGESSRNANVESQMALDEALARSLQELGDDFEDFYITEHSGTMAGKIPFLLHICFCSHSCHISFICSQGLRY